MAPLRTAILGCGSFAPTHARILAALPGEIELVAFCNRTLEKARDFSKEFTGGRAPVFSDHHAMLDQVKVDLLAILLPPYAHTDEVETAAERGIHIFIEKPVALTREKAWAMTAAVEKAGIKSQVGFQLRFGAAVNRLKGLIASGEAGPVGLMAARYDCNSLHTDWWRRRDLSGGQMVEQAIHLIDLMRFILGDPVTVFSRQANVFHQDVPDYSVEDVSVTVAAFPSGALGVICATNGAIPNQWTYDFRVVAEKITGVFPDANHAEITRTGGPELEVQTVASEADLYHLEWLDLIGAIRAGREAKTPMREGAKSLDLTLAAVQSALERRELPLG